MHSNDAHIHTDPIKPLASLFLRNTQSLQVAHHNHDH